MLHRARCLPRWLRSWSELALLICALGCEADTELHYHGRVRVAVGDFSVLSLHGDTHDEYAFVRDHAHDDELVILPFHGRRCSLGTSARYAVLQSERGLRVAMLSADASPSLRVLDQHCKAQITPIAEVVDLAFAGDRLLVTTGGGRLDALDPWQGTLSTISRAFTARGSIITNEQLGRALWLLEGDTLVLRDFAGHELRRAGRHVHEIALARDGQSMIFSDDRGLYQLAGDGSAAKRLGAAGCSLRYEPWLDAKASANVAMLLSPCERGRLTLIDAAGKATVMAEGVVSYFPRHFVSDVGSIENWTFYVTQTDPAAAKRYFMAPPLGVAHEVDVPISVNSTLFPFRLASGSARAWLVTTAEVERRFGLFTVGRGFQELAQLARTLAVSPAGFVLLHDYDKASGGTLSLLDAERGELRVLARAVPDDGLFEWGPAPSGGGVPGVTRLPSADAVLHDVDVQASSGTLARIESNARLLDIADGVPTWSPNAYGTLIRGEQLVAAARGFVVLTYLHDFDAKTKTGTLSLVAPDGQRMTIDHDVASYVPSDDPDREGVLYATSGNGAHEVWFVRQ